jgi:hypothetical protein
MSGALTLLPHVPSWRKTNLQILHLAHTIYGQVKFILQEIYLRIFLYLQLRNIHMVHLP